MDAKKLPFALQGGTIVHISEVTRGLECNCTCPFCYKPLIAKKGDQRSPHFAHYQEDCHCSWSRESLLHLAAKKILIDEKRLFYPDIAIYPNRVDPGKIIELDEVIAEKQIGNIRVDLLGYLKGRPLIVELCVTHSVGSEKVAKIRKIGTSAIEINLSGLLAESDSRELPDLDQLKDWVIRKAGRRWIFNQKMEELRARALKEAINLSREERMRQWYEFQFCPLRPVKVRDLENCRGCSHRHNVGKEIYCFSGL